MDTSIPPETSPVPASAPAAPVGALQRKLAEVLSSCQAKNPSYSMRAFAKRLGLHSGALSALLNGKRNVSQKMAIRLLDRLNVGPEEQSVILKEFAEKRRNRPEQTFARLECTQLLLDQYHILGNWWHYAFLSLLKTKDFQPDAVWIAARLGIRTSEAESAIERLLRTGLIEATPEGSYRRTTVRLTTSDETANSSLRKAHAMNLELARHSLEQDDVSVRDFTAITMPIDPHKLGQAKELIRKFLDQLSGLLESGEQTEVYKFCTQLYPLSKRSPV